MKLNEVIAKYGNQEVDESKIKEVLGVKESKVWKPDLKEKYYLYINSSTETVSPSSLCYMCFQGTIYTTSLESLKAFVKDNEADIKKYMFGVK